MAYVYNVQAWCPLRQEEAVGSPGTRNISACELGLGIEPGSFAKGAKLLIKFSLGYSVVLLM